MSKATQKPKMNMFRCKRQLAPCPGAPAKPPFRLCGERRGSGMNELSPKAEAKNMELAPTMKRGFFHAQPVEFRQKFRRKKWKNEHPKGMAGLYA